VAWAEIGKLSLTKKYFRSLVQDFGENDEESADEYYSDSDDSQDIEILEEDEPFGPCTISFFRELFKAVYESEITMSRIEFFNILDNVNIN